MNTTHPLPAVTGSTCGCAPHIAELESRLAHVEQEAARQAAEIRNCWDVLTSLQYREQPYELHAAVRRLNQQVSELRAQRNSGSYF